MRSSDLRHGGSNPSSSANYNYGNEAKLNKESYEDEFESGFYDKKRLEELEKAKDELRNALLNTSLGKLVVWCVVNLNRLINWYLTK